MADEKHREARLLAARALRRTATVEERAVLERATAEILRLKEALSRNFCELGYWLKRVRDESLYRARGHATFEAYLKKEVDLHRTTAYGFIRVAERLPMEFAVALGSEKAQSLVSFLDATPKEETLAEVLGLEIAVERNGKRVVVPVARATKEEINAAARRVRGRVKRRARGKLPPGLGAFMRRAEPALRKLRVSVSTDGKRVAFGPVVFERLGDFHERLVRLLEVR